MGPSATSRSIRFSRIGPETLSHLLSDSVQCVIESIPLPGRDPSLLTGREIRYDALASTHDRGYAIQGLFGKDPSIRQSRSTACGQASEGYSRQQALSGPGLRPSSRTFPDALLRPGCSGPACPHCFTHSPRQCLRKKLSTRSTWPFMTTRQPQPDIKNPGLSESHLVLSDWKRHRAATTRKTPANSALTFLNGWGHQRYSSATPPYFSPRRFIHQVFKFFALAASVLPSRPISRPRISVARAIPTRPGMSGKSIRPRGMVSTEAWAS